MSENAPGMLGWVTLAVTNAAPGAAAPEMATRSRTVAIPHNATAYKLRNRIERFFNKLKHFRRIATRYDRRAVYFLSALYLASTMIWMR